jgi:hypothetical protein
MGSQQNNQVQVSEKWRQGLIMKDGVEKVEQSWEQRARLWDGRDEEAQDAQPAGAWRGE